MLPFDVDKQSRQERNVWLEWWVSKSSLAPSRSDFLLSAISSYLANFVQSAMIAK